MYEIDVASPQMTDPPYDLAHTGDCLSEYAIFIDSLKVHSLVRRECSLGNGQGEDGAATPYPKVVLPAHEPPRESRDRDPDTIRMFRECISFEMRQSRPRRSEDCAADLPP